MNALMRRRGMMVNKQSMVLAYSMADPALWSMGVIATGLIRRGDQGGFSPNIWSYFSTKSICTNNGICYPAENLKYLSIDDGFVAIIALDAGRKYIGGSDLLSAGVIRLEDLALKSYRADEADVPYDSSVKYLQFSARKSNPISGSDGEKITTAFAAEQNLRLYY